MSRLTLPQTSSSSLCVVFRSSRRSHVYLRKGNKNRMDEARSPAVVEMNKLSIPRLEWAC